MQEHDLESFDYDRELVASVANKTFPDVVLKNNHNNPLFLAVSSLNSRTRNHIP